jgi:60 kDa SS-A/Ro ribonucleoprotein
MKVNAKATDYRTDTAQLAGGFGALAAKQSPEALLRRAVLANLLWENVAYEGGASVADAIRTLIPQIEPSAVAAIAVEARTEQKLRHVPLLIAREMARLDTHKSLVGALLPQIILRADEITEFVALYWRDGKQPLSKQVKIGLARAFDQFNAYNLAKYNRDTQVKLRDVLFLTHAKPGQGREEVYRQLATNTLPVPDTWEVALSSGADKKATWERLITEGKLRSLAFVRNLRNMEQVGVSSEVIAQGFAALNPEWLLPLNYLAAAKAAPRWQRELEDCMLRGLAQAPKLPGYSVLVIDVSGSMGEAISARSDFTRLDAGAAMAVLGAEMCERVAVYATAGSDYHRIHATERIASCRGFALSDALTQAATRLGGGGIFTRQCLEYIATQERETPDRVMIFSDSQDCDFPDRRIPRPFGKRNYIVDVSAHTRGINYEGVWTAEISGWSEHFLSYIAALEAADANA